MSDKQALLLKVALFAMLVVLNACTTRTEFGECVGVMDQHKPGLRYEFSIWNGFLAVVAAETIVVPVYTVAKDIECPVGTEGK